MGLSIRAYARHRGVSHTAVEKAIAAGRISTLADGSIDAAMADVEWEQNTLYPRAGGDSTEFMKARTVHEHAACPGSGPAAPRGGRDGYRQPAVTFSPAPRRRAPIPIGPELVLRPGTPVRLAPPRDG